MRNILKVGIMLSLLFVLTGCQEPKVFNDVNKVQVHTVDNNKQKNMPEKMPDDFDFKVRFGINSKNEINTYENTVTKDLVVDGTASIAITFSDEEMTRIYEKMKEVNVMEKKKIIPKNKCVLEPHGEDEWTITINGQVIEHQISEQYCEKTEDVRQMQELRNVVISLLETKEEYINLPDANGAYE